MPSEENEAPHLGTHSSVRDSEEEGEDAQREPIQADEDADRMPKYLHHALWDDIDPENLVNYGKKFKKKEYVCHRKQLSKQNDDRAQDFTAAAEDEVLLGSTPEKAKKLPSGEAR